METIIIDPVCQENVRNIIRLRRERDELLAALGVNSDLEAFIGGLHRSHGFPVAPHVQRLLNAEEALACASGYFLGEVLARSFS